MRHVLQFISVLVLSCLMTFTVKAQDNSYACLGIWCYVNVHLSTDPVDGGYLKYTIPVPSEGISPYGGVQGPGSPILFNNLGNTVELWLRRVHVDLAANGQNCELPVEFRVNKWTTGWGSYSTIPGNGTQCYYWIVLLVEQ